MLPLLCAEPLACETSDHERLAVVERHAVLAAITTEVVVNEAGSGTWRRRQVRNGAEVTVWDRIVVSGSLESELCHQSGETSLAWLDRGWSGSLGVTSAPGPRRHALAVAYTRSMGPGSAWSQFVHGHSRGSAGLPDELRPSSFDHRSASYLFTFIRDPVAVAFRVSGAHSRREWNPEVTAEQWEAGSEVTTVLVVNDLISFFATLGLGCRSAPRADARRLATGPTMLFSSAMGIRFSGKRWFASLGRSPVGAGEELSLEGGVEWVYPRGRE